MWTKNKVRDIAESAKLLTGNGDQVDVYQDGDQLLKLNIGGIKRDALFFFDGVIEVREQQANQTKYWETRDPYTAMKIMFGIENPPYKRLR